jgi:hypothetical protein
MFQESAIWLRPDGSKIKVKTSTKYTENYPEASNDSHEDGAITIS